MHCDSTTVRHEHVRCGDVTLHCALAGSGRTIVLLHGFPDYWYGWRHQMPELVAGGARVIAPDLRGYNLSEKPEGVAAYSVGALAADVAALVERLCPGERVVLAGHDWGGVIAWELAARRPELLSKLVILNAPHPAQYRRSLLRSVQALRSWYAGMFQLPWLPERAVRGLLPRMLRGHGLTEAEVACYLRAFPDSAAFHAPLNYYRAAAARLFRRRPETSLIEVDTLVIWGERDPYLDASLLEGLELHVPGVDVRRFAGAGHFVQWEEPAAVSRLLLSAVTPSDLAGEGG